MANIKSNKKSYIQNEKKRVLNHSKVAELRTSVKKTKTTKATKDLQHTYTLADKAAKANRIHKNKANRIKSRTAQIVNNPK